MISYLYYETPLGRLRLRAEEEGLIAVDHVNQQSVLEESWRAVESHPILQQAVQELRQYFHEERKEFTVPLVPKGTAFQLQVWTALQTIPYGQTASYSEIAERIGNPKAVRAVGTANGRNPLSILIPCHRVIGKAGALVGYAGGMRAKQFLLDLESKSEGLNAW